MSRKRGRIILVGVIGLDISRSDFYEKELTFQVSCSYGPGRYDDEYESKGVDYPLPFVRWTEKRNFETILQSISNNAIGVKHLISEVVKFEDFDQVYSNIGSSKSIASILEYSQSEVGDSVVDVSPKSYAPAGAMGVIGAGNFTKAMILPSLAAAKAPIKYIASSGGLSSKLSASKFGAAKATTDYRTILEDDEIGMTLITTRHNQHASLAVEALNAGKHVFVEKPLALSKEEIEEIEKASNAANKSVVVGFNRRFSPHITHVKKFLGSSEVPINMIATMNAGFIPANSWVHDMEVGGGRLIGEACHYLDLLSFITGSPIKAVCVNSMGTSLKENTDNASILVRFTNGSNGCINYFANGSKVYSKERIEVYSQERTFITDNFRLTKAYGVKGLKKLKTKQDKGHKVQFQKLTDFLSKGGEPIISHQEVMNISKASLGLIESLKSNAWVEIV